MEGSPQMIRASIVIIIIIIIIIIIMIIIIVIYGDSVNAPRSRQWASAPDRLDKVPCI